MPYEHGSPRCVCLLEGTRNDGDAVDLVLIEVNAIYVANRALVAVARRQGLHLPGLFFFFGIKSNLGVRRTCFPLAKCASGIIGDQTIAGNVSMQRMELSGRIDNTGTILSDKR